VGYIESQDEQKFMIQHLRNLLVYVHTSFLILIQFIMERFPVETLSVNVWASKLDVLI